MQKEVQSHIAEWSDIIMSSIDGTNSFGIALFSESGQLIYSNAALKKLCSDFNSSCLIHPTFDKIVSIESENNLLFSGYLTIGKMNTVNTSILANIYRKQDKILITGGFEVTGLIEQNKSMHFLNQKVTNLQRQLMQEKAELESTMRKLQETQQMLIQSEKMNALGQMVAGVAHEINNPIAFVTNNLHELDKYITELLEVFSELEQKFDETKNSSALENFANLKEKIEFDYLSEDIKDVIKESQSGVERVKIIVEDLRRFSRLDESEIKHIDLIENIQSTLSIIKREIEKKEIDFTIKAPDNLYTDCFPGQLNQAIINILLNAIFAVEKKGKIFLYIAEQENNILISVEDNGSGISEENLQKIFNPFFTTKPVGSGTGLGLSITYKIITDLHNGNIDVISEEGMGTTFKLNIPKKINA